MIIHDNLMIIHDIRRFLGGARQTGADLADNLGMSKGDVETRQCVLLALAGADLWKPGSHPPAREQVQQQARTYRLELWNQAFRASADMGAAAPLISK